MDAAIRRIEPDDWERMRRMREMLLADAPEAFDAGSSPTGAWDRGAWRRWCSELADSDTEAAWYVDGAPDWQGLVVAAVAAHETGVSVGWGWLWVAPALRRTGVAARLIGTVHDWAVSLEADRCWLWVAEGNSDARRLYAGLGYRPSGVWSSPSPSGRREERWDLALDALSGRR